MKKNTPLVSVIMPAYNSLETIPLALASLFAQKYKNWECIVVDDGSSDETANFVAKVQVFEPRIRFIKLEKNHGRAVARQTALKNAKGQYLAMVDADDWIYPSKLKSQVLILQENPELALVSSGMAIVDSDNNIVRVRQQSQEFVIHPPLRVPRLPLIAHAPSMIRMEIAKSVGYDSRFSQTEDTDFLLRILMKNSFAIIRRPLYAYAEHNNSLNSKIIINSQLNRIKILWRYWLQFPFCTFLSIFKILVKLFGLIVIKFLHIEKILSTLRPHTIPTEEDIVEFNQARNETLGKMITF